ncbi:50S ribosomal protein L28-like [Hibiscus syriacus]|uniref:50S ribosomal protein L28-like n=1 Tax=Hibiscus syriacus TaxID=106335 RepID=UPI001923966B|nr:50S ribosomal protein L28-like [Hibiscus syriacus]
MAFRGKEMMKMVKKVGENNLAPAGSRSLKPNVQERHLFSYILDHKVTTHALRCIDKAGGIDEYLLKTPYHKMDTEMALSWRAKIEKMDARRQMHGWSGKQEEIEDGRTSQHSHDETADAGDDSSDGDLHKQWVANS